MTLTQMGPLLPIGVCATTLLAALVPVSADGPRRVIQSILLGAALVGSAAGYVATSGTLSSSGFGWLTIPGRGSAILANVYIGPESALLIGAIALLTLVTRVALPPATTRLDAGMLFGASTAVHVVVVGNHLLLRLAALEWLLLSVLLLVLQRRTSILGLLVAHRIAAGALLLAALIAGGWQVRLFGEVTGTDSVTWVAGLVLLAALALSGGFPFHRSLLPIVSLPAAVRAHISGLLLLAAGGLVLRVVEMGDWTGSSTVGFGFILPALAAAILSLASTDLRRAQLWAWSSQLAFAVALTLSTPAVIAAGVWVCLALVRPAAAWALDVVDAALGDTADANRWGGLAASLPVACWMSVLAAVGVAGLPPWGLFILHGHLLATQPPATPEFAMLALLPALVVVPALRLGLWPFLGSPRHSVLAPQEQTAVPSPVVAAVIFSAVIGGLWPLTLLLTQHLPSTPALGTVAALGLVLLLVTGWVGRRRPDVDPELSASPLRQFVGDGLALSIRRFRGVTGGLRQLAWLVDIVSLVPGVLVLVCRGVGWGVTWVESRPLWWAVLTTAAMVAAILGGRL